MKFEINEHMDINERLNVVCKEIIQKYPNIGIDDSLKIASLCDTITEKSNTDVIFNRYYNILRIIGKNHILYQKVFKDMLRQCDGKIENEIYKYLYEDLLKFGYGELLEFPNISDYYNQI